MKSVILYALKPGTGCAGPYWPVYASQSEIPVFVRAQIVEADPLHALDLAKPEPGETVLNSIPYEP